MLLANFAGIITLEVIMFMKEYITKAVITGATKTKASSYFFPPTSMLIKKGAK